MSWLRRIVLLLLLVIPAVSIGCGPGSSPQPQGTEEELKKGLKKEREQADQGEAANPEGEPGGDDEDEN